LSIKSFYDLKDYKGVARVTQGQRSSPKIIKSGSRMMGEGIIPHKEFEDLHDEQVKIFLTEADPEKWPPGLSRLRKYAAEDSAA
jgi:hypothetical protein